MQHYIVVGSSRGLGAALVTELLRQEAAQVIGLARTKLADVPQAQQWQAAGRYRHVAIDLGAPQTLPVLKAVCAEMPPVPVCVIFNAAAIQQDVKANGALDYETVRQINRVNIDGLTQVLEAFEAHLLTYRGAVVGISSVWGVTPPLGLPWIAYPASKAYLNLFCRCLRVAWQKQVPVMTVHLGVIGGGGASTLATLAVPTYQMAAQKIVRSIAAGKGRRNLRYPLWQAAVYQCLRLLPDALLARLFAAYGKR